MKYPDLEFLRRLDKDNDYRISRPEYEEWAGRVAASFKEAKVNTEQLQKLQMELLKETLPAALRQQYAIQAMTLNYKLNALASQQAHLQSLERIAASANWHWWV